MYVLVVYYEADISTLGHTNEILYKEVYYLKMIFTVIPQLSQFLKSYMQMTLSANAIVTVKARVG